MLTELFSYDPAEIDPERRKQMSIILSSRAAMVRAQADVGELRARTWAGEDGLNDIIDLKAADLDKLREDYRRHVQEMLSTAVDVQGLLETLPMLALAVLQKFNVPPMLLLEALGVDFDALKVVTEGIKDMIENGFGDEDEDE